MKTLLRLLCAILLISVCCGSSGCGTCFAHHLIEKKQMRPCIYPGVVVDSCFLWGAVHEVGRTGGVSLLGVPVLLVDTLLSAVADTVMLPGDIVCLSLTDDAASLPFPPHFGVIEYADEWKCSPAATWLASDELAPQSVELDGNVLTFRFATDRGPRLPETCFLEFTREKGNFRLWLIKGARADSLVAVDLPEKTKRIRLWERYQTKNGLSECHPSVLVDVGTDDGENYYATETDEREHVAVVELCFELSEDFCGNFVFGKSKVFVDRADPQPLQIVNSSGE